VLGAVAIYSYWSAKVLLQNEKADEVRLAVSSTATRIDLIARSIERTTLKTSVAVASAGPDARAAGRAVRSAVSDNPDLYGSAAGFDPSRYQRISPYAYRSYGGLVQTNLAAGGSAYEMYDWFQLPYQLRKPVWTEPYFVEGGADVVMSSYAIPVNFGGSASPGAVVTGDLALEALGRVLAQLDLGDTGYAFIISRTGVFISHPLPALLMNESIFSVAEARQSEELRAIGTSMVRGEKGFVAFDGLAGLEPDEASWLAYGPVTTTGWSVGIVYADSEISQAIVRLSRVQWAIAFAGILALVVVSWLIARTITRPIRILETAATTLARGDLLAPLPVALGHDEIAHLTTSFSEMRDDLRRHIEELQASTAARERIESELRIAASIQMSLVPRTFPPFPERDDLELQAILEPAREVGGDFYDFFFLDERRLCLTIADVSGKGVPAALFMAVTRSFLRSFAHAADGPGNLLATLNRELSEDNENCMFVTMFLAFIDVVSGDVIYASAGHNPPFLVDADGRVELVPRVRGVGLGISERAGYEESFFSLAHGETLFLYTDGVTEAMDEQGHVLGEEPVHTALAGLAQVACEAVIAGVLDVIHEHAGAAEQSDDITMVAFRSLRHGGEGGDEKKA
jgi:sigma-B regulation protein RsbU (phosphoserine phosphatase)